MKTSDFDFDFPEHLIAFQPLPRGESRLLVAGRQGEFIFGRTRDLGNYLAPGDALVLNDTRVLRARLVGKSETGWRAEALLLAPHPGEAGASDGTAGQAGERWEAMVKPAKRFRVGDRAIFSPRLSARVAGVLDDGIRILEFNLRGEDFRRELEVTGKIPLPPYIKREAEARDDADYQSVFAAREGSVAAPTASLHFDQAMLDGIAARGVRICKLTLHVGAGTFKPVQSEDVESHSMHSETFDFPEGTAAALNEVRARGGRIWAVGTTAARVLESRALGPREAPFVAGSGQTRIFIYPGYAWKAVDGLLTNFHWPKSTLFMLVCSLLGTERAKEAYREAFAREMRLFSYGDAMLIRRSN
jgi:S-adenosylmethionine:tRNA ribosyltransferase-isomerase